MESKILIIVEGAKTDLRLMQHLLNVYGIDKRHKIISFNTNIYTLYNLMFADGDPDSLDLLQVLKERERDAETKKIFDAVYSDILLIFDLDPQAPDYSAEKISTMLSYFTESSDMGKLYINYPMVEAFYHMKSIPDADYASRCISFDQLNSYKTIVNAENRNHDYTKFAVDKSECNIVINQNIEKGILLAGNITDTLPDSTAILNKEIELLETENKISVLCTCSYYIAEYNPEFIK